jgi:hypothetical protein
VVRYRGRIAIEAGDIYGGCDDVDAGAGNPDAVRLFGVFEVFSMPKSARNFKFLEI